MKKLLTVLLSLVIVIGMLPTVAFAAAGDVPSHDKILKVNNDGTYTLALNVTGDAEKQIQRVNVIVIVDRSGSMNEQSGTGAYVASNTNGATMYGYIDGEYRLLERNGGGLTPVTYSYEGTVYTGQRYIYDNTATRLQATQAAVNGLANTLLSYNGKDDNPDDTVEMALVSFSTNATTDVAKTSDAATFTGAVNGLAQGGGTNWEAALQEANDISFGDSDPTYVIFFSDGAPTFHASNGGYNNWNNQYGVYGSGQEQEPNMERSYTQATDDAAALAQKVGTERFYTIFAYGTNVGAGYMTDLTEAAGAPSDNNYSASNTVELEEAFAAILEAIEMAGIGAVAMDDGTTTNVTLEADPDASANLLTIDENSYNYYRAGGDYSNIEDYDPENGVYGVEWSDAPEAKLENGSVKWDLSSEGVLENGVTYTVTFDCWPSQTTLDIVADIKNDPSAYDKLDNNIKKYIDRDGNLKTNTTASLSYTDTRTGESNTEEFDNPDPVSTTAVEELAITKEWENPLDSQSATGVTLTVTRDGDPKYELTLDNGNNWTDTVFISIGIIRGTDVLEKGHDFTFTEPADLGYYWEIDVPTVRPMMIDGTLTMLILKDDKHDNPDGTKEYEIDGNTYYVGETGEAALTAVNHRRSRLNITKVVDGKDADPAQKFPFTVNVVDSKASEGSEDNLDSDYWVWFSVYNGGYVDAVVSGAEKEMKDGEWTGYYYAPSGTDIVLELGNGDNLRFLNLPSDSTYTITEGTLPTNYTFTSSELTQGDDDEFSGAQTTTGTIVETSTDYTVTYTNTYALYDLEITKVWEDNDNQDGYRPTAEEFVSWLTLKAGDTDVTSDNADKLEVTENEDGTYTAKWTGLTRFENGEEIEYTVTETPSEYYTPDVETVSDGETITNTHETETVDVPVEKKWEGPAGDAVTVTLYADGKATENTLELNTSNEWKGIFEDLPKKANGKDIEYTVVEDGVSGVDADKYDTTVSGDAEEGFVITNTNTETVTVTAKKAWDDASDQDGIRPEELTLTLNGAPDDITVPEPTVEKDGDTWTYTWEGLPKYTVDGEEIAYTVTEDEVPVDYECETVTVDDGGTITNVHTPDVVSVDVEKKWIGPEGDAVTVTLYANGKATDNTLELNANNEWKGTFEDLPKNAAGEPIEYTVVEDGVSGVDAEKYATEVTGSMEDGFVITNTNIETIDVKVRKFWDDESNRDGVRPETLTLTLNGAPDGTEIPDPSIVKSADGNTWTYTWEGVPKYDQTTGEELTYTVTEETVPEGYECDETTVETDGTITNTHEIETTEVTVTKKWDDDSDRDAMRPDQLELTLNNVPEGHTAPEPTVEKNGDTWTYTWTDVPKNVSGKEIKYTVTEETVPTGYTCDTTTVDAGGTITNSHKIGTTTVEVKKSWVDDGDAYKVRPAELTLTLHGVPEGYDTPEPKVTKDGDTWTYRWEDLPKMDNGEDIVYTVTEDEVPVGYVLSPVDPVENGDTITNTFKPVWGDPPVKKEITGDKPVKDETFTFKLTAVSTDAEGVDKLPMPDAASGAQEMTIEVVGASSKEFGKFALVVPGKYTYKITEESGDAEGYTYSKEEHTIVYNVTLNDDNSLKCVKTVDGVEIEGDENDEANVTKFTFTNEYKKPVVSVKVSKVWEDGNNENLTRPESITVMLYANGKETGKTLELSKANEWAGTFEDVDKYDEDGNAIKYTVDETAIPEGYVAEVTGDMENGFVIVNSVDVPPTGDTSDIFLWSGLSLTSLIGLGYLFFKRRKEEEK